MTLAITFEEKKMAGKAMKKDFTERGGSLPQEYRGGEEIKKKLLERPCGGEGGNLSRDNPQMSVPATGRKSLERQQGSTNIRGECRRRQFIERFGFCTAKQEKDEVRSIR